MSLGRTIRQGSAWLLSGRLANRAAEFLFGVALARILFPEDFGMLVTLQIFTGVAGFIAGGGMGQALVQAKHVEEIHYRVVFSLQLVICALIYLGLFLLAPFVAVWFDNPLYTDLMRVAALSFLIRPFQNIPVSKLNREMQFKKLTVVQTLRPLVAGTASVALALSGAGVWSLVLGGLLAGLAILPLLYYLSAWKPGVAYDRGIARQLGTYGIKFSLSDIVVYMKAQLPNIFISRFIGAAPLGIYNKADSLSLMPLQIVAAPIRQTVFRGLSKVREDPDLSKYIYFRTLSLMGIYITPIFVMAWWLAEPFIGVIYGPKWLAVIPVLKVLCWVGVVRTVMRPAGIVIEAFDRIGREVILHLETLAILGVAIWFAMDYGLNGIAWVVFAVSIYTCIRLTRQAYRCIDAGIKDFFRAIAPAIQLNVMLFLVLAVVHQTLAAMAVESISVVNLVVPAMAGTVFYVTALAFLPIRNIESEAKRVRGVISRISPLKA